MYPYLISPYYSYWSSFKGIYKGSVLRGVGLITTGTPYPEHGSGANEKKEKSTSQVVRVYLRVSSWAPLRASLSSYRASINRKSRLLLINGCRQCRRPLVFHWKFPAWLQPNLYPGFSCCICCAHTTKIIKGPLNCEWDG